jgi:hypothetical protein
VRSGTDNASAGLSSDFRERIVWFIIIEQFVDEKLDKQVTFLLVYQVISVRELHGY